MGQLVVIAVSRTWTLSLFRDILAECCGKDRVIEFPGQIEVLFSSDGTGGRCLILERINEPDEALVEYICNDDLNARFRSDVLELDLYSVRFHDIGIVRLLLRSVCKGLLEEGVLGWIDTDYGWVISSLEFMQRVDIEPDWDWRFSRVV